MASNNKKSIPVLFKPYAFFTYSSPNRISVSRVLIDLALPFCDHRSAIISQAEAMKHGVSSLNPYAAAYIPLSKRGADDRTYVTATESKENPYYNPQDQLYSKVSLDCGAHGSARQFYGSSSRTFNEVADKQISDEEFDMDLEFLQMTFTGISGQSLADVYLANKGDLEATVDMLNQLESCTVESSDSLPDTLDIGDISETGSSTHFAPSKLKNVPIAAEPSSKVSDTAIIS